MSEKNLPRTEDVPQKVVRGGMSGLGAGALLAGGAVVGCFALALWNRKALVALVKNRGHRKNPAETDAASETDAIY